MPTYKKKNLTFTLSGLWRFLVCLPRPHNISIQAKVIDILFFLAILHGINAIDAFH